MILTLARINGQIVRRIPMIDFSLTADQLNAAAMVKELAVGKTFSTITEQNRKREGDRHVRLVF